MAASLARSSRAAARLLATKASVTQQRGYADEMSFTFAAANQVGYISFDYVCIPNIQPSLDKVLV